MNILFYGAGVLGSLMAAGDNYRLARNRKGLVLLVRAIREGYRVLRALGIPITPASHRVFAWIPEPILVALLRRGLNTKTAEIEIAGHANAARDEFTELGNDFRVMARSTSVPTPAMDRLYAYTDPAVRPDLPEPKKEKETRRPFGLFPIAYVTAVIGLFILLFALMRSVGYFSVLNASDGQVVLDCPENGFSYWRVGCSTLKHSSPTR